MTDGGLARNGNVFLRMYICISDDFEALLSNSAAAAATLLVYLFPDLFATTLEWNCNSPCHPHWHRFAECSGYVGENDPLGPLVATRHSQVLRDGTWGYDRFEGLDQRLKSLVLLYPKPPILVLVLVLVLVLEPPR